MEVRIARYHNIFGPEGSWNDGKEKAPAAVCRKVAMAPNGGEVEIWGDGKQTRSFLYIDECLEGTLRLMRSDFTGPVNIGSDEMVTIDQLVDMVAGIAGKTIKKRHIDGPTGVRGRNSDNRLIREKLNWSPSTVLVDGLRPTYAWISGQVMRNARKRRRGAASISGCIEADKHPRSLVIARQRTVTIARHDAMTTKRLVYICDWLPPDFGAVGQYAVLFARQWASEGWAVTLVGLTSGPSSRQAAEPVGDGSLEVIRIHRRTYKKQKFVARLVWTVVSNVLLLGAAFQRHAAGGCGSLYRQPAADAAFHRATQSLAQEAAHLSHHGFPSGMPHRRARTQRTDSSLAASVSRSSGDVVLMRSKCWALDQARRLAESGIAEERIRLKRDPSPVAFAPGLVPLPLPDELRGGCRGHPLLGQLGRRPR